MASFHQGQQDAEEVWKKDVFFSSSTNIVKILDMLLIFYLGIVDDFAIDFLQLCLFF